MSSRSFGSTVRVACVSLCWGVALGAGLLCAWADRATAAPAERVQARIIEARGADVVVISAGTDAGVKNRAVFDVYQPARVVKLPMTEEVAYVPERVVARLVVVETERTTAVGRVVPPPGGDKASAREGDLVVSNPVAASINIPPYVKSLTASSTSVKYGDRVTLKVDARDEAHDRVYFDWHASAGLLGRTRTTLPEVEWIPPVAKGNVEITVTAVDTAGNSASAKVKISNAGYTGIDKNVYQATRRLGEHGSMFASCNDVAFDEQGTAFLVAWSKEQVLGVREGWKVVLETQELTQDFKLDRAVARGGFLYALDVGERRAVKLRIGQKMLQEKPATTYGRRGVGNGQFEAPIDIAVDSRGRVYVLDGSEDRPAVHIFDNSGRFDASLGAKGSGEGQWTRPTAIGVSHDDTLYVLDDGRKKVLVYRDLRYDGEFAAGGASDKLADCKVDPFSGRVSVLDSSSGKVRTYTADGSPTGKVFGKIGRFLNQWQEPRRLRYDNKGTLYLISGEGQVLHRLDPAAGVELGRWGGVNLGRTTRIAVGPDGNVAMLMANDALVAVLDGEGWITALFGGDGDAAGKFDKPVDVAMDAEGNVAVLDAGKSVVEVFDRSGNPQRVIGKAGSSSSELDDVVAIGTDAGGKYFLTIQNTDRYNVKVYDLRGQLKASLPGKEELLEDPIGVCMSPQGRIYAARDDGELWYLDVGAKLGARPFIEAKGESQVRAGKWRIGDVDRPNRLVTSEIGLMFLAERGGFIQVWDTARSAPLTQIKDPKSLDDTSDVAVDGFDRVYVWDGSAKRVVVFER
jgi:hypothetical protein